MFLLYLRRLCQIETKVHGLEAAEMKTRVATLVSGLAVSIVLFAGCGGDPPKAELDGATKALQEAKDAGAERFAKSELSAAQGAYDSAKDAYDKEGENLFKNWDEVKPLIVLAKSKADMAKSAAVSAKSRGKSAAESAIAGAAAAVQGARESLDASPSGKGTEGDIQQLRSDLDAADADLSAARSSVSGEDFDAASAKAASAKSKAATVSSGVEQAVARYNELVEKNTPWYMKM